MNMTASDFTTMIAEHSDDFDMEAMEMENKRIDDRNIEIIKKNHLTETIKTMSYPKWNADKDEDTYIDQARGLM